MSPDILTPLLAGVAGLLLVFWLIRRRAARKTPPSSETLTRISGAIDKIQDWERMVASLAQPLRSVILSMPIEGVVDKDMQIGRRLYQTGTLTPGQIVRAKAELAQHPFLSTPKGWTDWQADFRARKQQGRAPSALEYCHFCFMVASALDVRALDRREAGKLVAPLIADIRSLWPDWRSFGKAVKDCLASEKMPIGRRLAYRLQFRDLEKSRLSPWRLIRWGA